MGKIDQCIAQVLQSRQQWELGAVVRGDRLEDIIPVFVVLGSDLSNRFHDSVRIAARYANHPVFAGLPLNHSKSRVIVTAFWPDAQVHLPVSELRTIFDAGWPFLDASAQNSLVFANSCCFGWAMQLFRKIIVTATSFTILLVGGLPDFCLVTEDVAPIKSDGTWSIGSSPCEWWLSTYILPKRSFMDFLGYPFNLIL